MGRGKLLFQMFKENEEKMKKIQIAADEIQEGKTSRGTQTDEGEKKGKAGGRREAQFPFRETWSGTPSLSSEYAVGISPCGTRVG